VRCGTPGFVAPEIINIRDMSTKSEPISDVFSAGVIFHHLLFGTSIFEGKKYNDILSQNRACDFNFGHEIYAKLNNKTLDLLIRMLEKDPTKRISAEVALSHGYFTGEMDIEKEQKKVFRETTNFTPSLKMKESDTIFSPSIVSKRKEDKRILLESTRKENSKAYYT
jgi:calcium-dependent protein kinase